MKITSRYLYIALSILLTNCASLDIGNNVAPGYVEAYQSINQAIFGYQTNIISKDLIYKIPYASLTVKIGKGPKGLLILESKNNEKELWVSSDNIFLEIASGKIISTKGLGNNLSGLILPKNSKRLSHVDEGFLYNYYYSFDNPALYNLKAGATFKLIGKEEVQLFDRSVKLFRIDEIIENKYLGWKVKNIYWLDDEGFVWKSEQNISPKLPTIYIEVTKKPS